MTIRPNGAARAASRRRRRRRPSRDRVDPLAAVGLDERARAGRRRRRRPRRRRPARAPGRASRPTTPSRSRARRPVPAELHGQRPDAAGAACTTTLSPAARPARRCGRGATRSAPGAGAPAPLVVDAVRDRERQRRGRGRVLGVAAGAGQGHDALAGAVASRTPATSVPGMSGSSSSARYGFSRWCVSAKFMPARVTRISTSSSAGSGTGSSTSSSTSGPPELGSGSRASARTTARGADHPASGAA